MMAALTFSGLNWLLPTALIALAALLVIARSYAGSAGGIVAWVCAALKTLGVTILALCLLEPLWTGQRAKPGANLFAIVVDNSAGLQIADAGEKQTRGELLKKLLNPETDKWQGTLADNFELHCFSFDSRLNSTRDFSGLNFAGFASAMGSALRGLSERFHGRPLAGVLLFTDGNATDIYESLPEASELPPIYPVVIGQPGRARDVSLAQIQVSQTAFEDAPVSVQANVAVTRLAGRSVTAELLDTGGKILEELRLRPSRERETLPFRFQWRPEKPGLSFYRLRVGLSEEIRSTNTISPNEATLANNATVLAVNRGHGPYRILYVSGRPNWDFKFLNRAEQEDDQVQLVALIRVALREPKFDFRGRAGETSNPLYRGFGNQSAEDVERYDQPVLIRLNTRNQLELQAGFPHKPEDLYGYDALILDDIEAAFFAPDQATLVQQFVSERGGSLLMLGGMECFRQGHYQRTPIGDMLPVYLDQPDETKPPANLRLNLSREGWLQVWARLRDNEADERTRLQSMPAFGVLNPVSGVKPAASVILSASDENGKQYPALVTQRFGRGRTAALMVGDLWRWGMQNPDARRDMEKSWRQLMRWLVADVPKRVELAVEPSADDAAGTVKLQVRARNDKFLPLDDATVSVEIKTVLSGATGVTTNAIRLLAERSVDEPGTYQTTYLPRYTGGYSATARVTNSVGVDLGQAEAGWGADLAAEEFRSLEPNTALLESIAKRTGGQIVPAAKLDEFARALPHRRSPVMEPWTTPAWHTPALFAFALTCLVAEWGLRRWKGLP